MKTTTFITIASEYFLAFILFTIASWSDSLSSQQEVVAGVLFIFLLFLASDTASMIRSNTLAGLSVDLMSQLNKDLDVDTKEEIQIKFNIQTREIQHLVIFRTILVFAGGFVSILLLLN